MGFRFYSSPSAVDRRMKERQQEKMAAAEQAREMELLEAKDESALALAGRQGKNALEQARLQQEGALEQIKLSEAGVASRQKNKLSFEQRKLEEEKRKTLLEKYNQMISPQYSKDGMLLSPGMSSKEALDKLSAGSTGIGMRFFGEEDITKTPKESPFLDSYREDITYDKEGNPYRTFTNSRSNLTKETSVTPSTPAKTTQSDLADYKPELYGLKVMPPGRKRNEPLKGTLQKQLMDWAERSKFQTSRDRTRNY